MSFFVSLIIALVLLVIAYAIMPKPKTPSIIGQDAEDPTAEAGKPMGVVFGTVTIRDGNILWYGDKSKQSLKVKA